jgi:hypothetical protein
MGSCMCSCYDKDKYTYTDSDIDDIDDNINNYENRNDFFIRSPPSKRSYSSNFYDKTILLKDEDMLLNKNSYNNDYLVYLKL